MNKIEIIYFFLFVLMLCSVKALTISYDDFLEVNVTETITATPVNGSCDAYIYFAGSQNQMSVVDSEYSISLNSIQEENVPFYILESTSEPYEKIYNDGSRESSFTINNNSLFVINYTHTPHHNLGDNETHIVCALLEKNTGNPSIRFVVGYNNTPDLTSFSFYNSTVQSVTSVTFQEYCAQFTMNYKWDMVNFTHIAGFQCTNCGGGNTILLGLDTNSSNTWNNSAIMTNFTHPKPRNYSNNFMIETTSLELVDECSRSFGTMLWRVPFNLTIRFKTHNSSTTNDYKDFDDEFTYVYMRKGNTLNYTSTFLQLDSMAYLDDWFGWMPYYKSSFTKTFDSTQSFWCRYDNAKCIMTLYEADLYDIYLLKTKTYFDTEQWTYEFYKPQYTKNSMDKLIYSDVNISQETNGNMTLYAGLWDINSTRVIFNWGYYLFFVVIWIVGTALILMSGSPMAIQATAGYTIALITIMKVLGLIIL